MVTQHKVVALAVIQLRSASFPHVDTERTMKDCHWAARVFVGWTEELVETIRKLWILDGLTATEIAEAIGANRNQVIGKLHREGLVGTGAKPRAVKVPYKSKKVAKQSKKRISRNNFLFGAASSSSGAAPGAGCEAERVDPPFLLVPPPPIQTTIKTDWTGIAAEIDTLRFRECRWPLGDPVSGFCRQQTEHYRDSYCPYHAAVAVYGKPKSEADAA
jgi:hypothetical protein